MATEDGNLIEFKRRGGWDPGGPTTPTPPKIPRWEITQRTKGDDFVLFEAEGYITSMMPFLIISSTKESKDINDAVYFTPCELIVNCSRVPQEASE